MQKYVSDQRFAVPVQPFVGAFRDEVLTVQLAVGLSAGQVLEGRF